MNEDVTVLLLIVWFTLLGVVSCGDPDLIDAWQCSVYEGHCPMICTEEKD